MRRSTYEAQKYQLQVELLKLCGRSQRDGQRVVILFEGRDAAGKGGAIKRFMEHLNPRGARVVARKTQLKSSGLIMMVREKYRGCHSPLRLSQHHQLYGGEVLAKNGRAAHHPVARIELGRD